MTGPRVLAVFDAQADEVATVTLADVAADIRRYEVLGSADSGVISGADPAPRGGAR